MLLLSHLRWGVRRPLPAPGCRKGLNRSLHLYDRSDSQVTTQQRPSESQITTQPAWSQDATGVERPPLLQQAQHPPKAAVQTTGLHGGLLAVVTAEQQQQQQQRQQQRQQRQQQLGAAAAEWVYYGAPEACGSAPWPSQAGQTQPATDAAAGWLQAVLPAGMRGGDAGSQAAPGQKRQPLQDLALRRRSPPAKPPALVAAPVAVENQANTSVPGMQSADEGRQPLHDVRQPKQTPPACLAGSKRLDLQHASAGIDRRGSSGSPRRQPGSPGRDEHRQSRPAEALDTDDWFSQHVRQAPASEADLARQSAAERAQSQTQPAAPAMVPPVALQTREALSICNSPQQAAATPNSKQQQQQQHGPAPKPTRTAAHASGCHDCCRALCCRSMITSIALN